MASFLIPCARCGALIRFMVEPDRTIPHFCGLPECVKGQRATNAETRRNAADARKQAEFDEAQRLMAEKKSVGQKARADMREARGPDQDPEDASVGR